MEVEFTTTKAQAEVITAIAKRAIAQADKQGWKYDIQDAEMDITACHCNGCPLDLEKLLAFDDGNFGHDVFGIRRFLDRSTGELGGCFLPRCSLPEEETA